MSENGRALLLQAPSSLGPKGQPGVGKRKAVTTTSTRKDVHERPKKIFFKRLHLCEEGNKVKKKVTKSMGYASSGTGAT